MLAQANEVFFEEEQRFRQTWLWVMLIGILLVLSTALALVLFGVSGREADAQGIAALSIAVAVEIGTIVLLYFLRLIVRVDANGLHIRFFPVLGKRDVPLEQIAHWEARTYRPILEYGGWGVRYAWKGMAYNVSGNHGVQLELTSGKRVLIGSQHPEELAEAIRRAKQG